MSVKRVTLAVDTTHRDRDALRDATRIAARLNAELTALFVTSAHLQRFAGLPTATEVLIRSARTRRPDPSALASELEHLTAIITDELRNFARELDVAWNVVSTPMEELPTSPTADLLLVDRRAGHTPVSRTELGSLAAKLVADCRKSILVFERELALDRPIGMLTEAHSSAALEMALELARESGRLLVLIDARDRRAYESERQRLRAAIARRDVVLETEWTRTPRGRLLGSILHGYNSGMLVLDADNALLQREGLASLLDALRIPVLITR